MNLVRSTLVGVMSACAVVGAGAGVVSACLPELAALPRVDVDGGTDAGITTFSGCGDGIIATNDDGGDAGETCDPGPAPAIGCSQACTISCGGLIAPSGHCYFLADPSDYQRALSNCSAAGAHVVTIGSENEAALVRAFAASAAPDRAYRVGLNFSLVAYKTPPFVDEPGYPHRAPGTSCPGCFAEPGLDPDAGSERDCVVALPDGRWLQVACNDGDAGALTICEREPIGRRSQSCGGPLCTTLAATAGKKRYVISISPATAAQADLFCRAYPGGSLAMFDSREEREELAREIRQLVPPSQQAPVLTAWIGLSRKDDVWVWDDGTPETGDAGRPAPWANAQPSPTGKGRAFMRLDINAFDTQLAVTGTDDGELRLFVCQRD